MCKSLTVLAGDGSKVEDVELAALGSTATAESWVRLGESNRSAGGEGEDGGGELHDGGLIDDVLDWELFETGLNDREDQDNGEIVVDTYTCNDERASSRSDP